MLPGSGTTGPEESPEQVSTTDRIDICNNVHLMIEHCTVQQVEVTIDGAGFRVGGAVDHTREPSVDHRPGTHRAGFECDVQGAVVETPGTQMIRGIT